MILFLALPVTGRAALIPYFRLDSLVLLSDVVVLCDEQSVVAPADRDGNTRVRCQVTRAFKGDLAPGARFGIVYDALYSRAPPGAGATRR